MKNFTNEEAKYLIELPKKVYQNDNLVDTETIAIESSFSMRYNLISEDEPDYQFLLDVKQGKKNNLKFDLHFQENESITWLLRVDYNGQHQNPEVANEFVPDFIRPYEGMWFEYSDHHIHYFVQGYKQLAWAVPLKSDSFPVKEITDFNSMKNAFIEFIKRVNIVTVFQFQHEKLFL
ncbi:MAG: hypothetical protein JXR58_11365 [Bacteroidales bacterium]|nr:hypothetical protein [Bacteroidales bacterium]